MNRISVLFVMMLMIVPMAVLGQEAGASFGGSGNYGAAASAAASSSSPATPTSGSATTYGEDAAAGSNVSGGEPCEEIDFADLPDQKEESKPSGPSVKTIAYVLIGVLAAMLIIGGKTRRDGEHYRPEQEPIVEDQGSGHCSVSSKDTTAAAMMTYLPIIMDVVDHHHEN